MSRKLYTIIDRVSEPEYRHGIASFSMRIDICEGEKLSEQGQSSRAYNAPLYVAGATHACAWLGKTTVYFRFGAYRSDYGARDAELIVFGVDCSMLKGENGDALRKLLPMLEGIGRMPTLRDIANAVAKLGACREIEAKSEGGSTLTGFDRRDKFTAEDIERMIRDALAKHALGAEYLARIDGVQSTATAAA